jgi:hypothetical protein
MDRVVNGMNDKEEILFLVREAKILVQRLERISADSIWARRASGHRGAILKWLDQYDDRKVQFIISETDFDQSIETLKHMMKTSYALLIKAAQEYPENWDRSAKGSTN